MSSTYVGHHRAPVVEDEKQTSYYHKMILRFGAPLAAAAISVLGFGSYAYADTVAAKSDTPLIHHQDTKTQTVLPLSNVPVIHLGVPDKPIQAANVFAAVQKALVPPPPPPAPTPPPPPPAPACNWIYPPHYWGDAQWANARTIYNVGAGRGISRDGEIIALMTAMQESQLYNLGYLGANNDHDSLGLFQQRPSSGWGTPDQVTDPVYASNNFYSHLLNVPNWWNLEKTWAAQDVQISAYPYAYAKWEADATDMATNFANCPA